MAEIDKFAALLLEEAKRFFERASDVTEGEARAAYLHAALMVGFCSLEAHVNAVAEEMSERKGVSAHERAVLLEKEIRLDDGQFVERGRKIFRLEDRLYLLHRRFGKGQFKKSTVLPNGVGDAINLRNSLTHPKGVPSISIKDIKDALEAIIETVDSLYRAIYGRRLPASARGLHSKLTF